MLRRKSRAGASGARFCTYFAQNYALSAYTTCHFELCAWAPPRIYERLGGRPVPEGMAAGAGQFDDVVYAFDRLADVAGRLA